MILDECPWCDKTFESNKYPHSAALSEIHKREKIHIRQTHPEYQKKYQEIVDIWKDRVLNGNLNTIMYAINKRRFPNISEDIVHHYEPDEIKQMKREELIELEEKFRK